MENKVRNSGVELLKIIGIMLIVISHIVQTLASNLSSNSSGFYLNIYHSTTNVTTFIIILLSHFGYLGNSIFFTCSAWFLVNHTKTNYKKILYILADVFIISILWLIPMLFVFKSKLGLRNIITSLMPTFFGNNWYITTYIIFCFIYPILNAFFDKINQRTHLLLALVSFVIFILLGTVYGIFGINALLIWSSVYIAISYLQNYHKKAIESKKFNILLLLASIFGFIFLLLAVNIIGLKIKAIGNRVQRFNNLSNIFFWLIAFCSLNLFKRIKWHSKKINYVSSLSLLVYLIHENILFRNKIRPLIWDLLISHFGGNYVLIWIGIFALTLFLASYIIAFIYDISLRKPIKKLADRLYVCLVSIFNKIQNLTIKKN